MVRASRSIVDPVKAYAAPVTPSNVTNLGGRNPAGACTLASLPRPLVALLGSHGRGGRRRLSGVLRPSPAVWYLGKVAKPQYQRSLNSSKARSTSLRAWSALTSGAPGAAARS